MEFSRFEAVMMAIFVGSTPQRKPSDMHMGVRIYDRIGLSPEMLAKYDGQPWATLVELLDEEDPIEIELDGEESKWIARVMVENVNVGPRMLKVLIPLWERLYTKWEEFGEK